MSSQFSPAEFLKEISPIISHTNTIIPSHSRLIPELIIVASPDKPFATTDKGTVRKGETLKLYEKEVENAYRTLENGVDHSRTIVEWPFKGEFTDVDAVREFVKDVIRTVLRDKLGTLVEPSDNDDIFEHGQ